MCASNHSADELRKLRKRKKPIRAWKVLRKDGRSYWLVSHPCKYGPGTAKAKGVTRNAAYGRAVGSHVDYRGLHAYRNKKSCRDYERGSRFRTVPVYIDPADLIAAEPASSHKAQLVACQLTIRPEDWEAAGLPKRATRRRYV